MAVKPKGFVKGGGGKEGIPNGDPGEKFRGKVVISQGDRAGKAN